MGERGESIGNQKGRKAVWGTSGEESSVEMRGEESSMGTRDGEVPVGEERERNGYFRDMFIRMARHG